MLLDSGKIYKIGKFFCKSNYKNQKTKEWAILDYIAYNNEIVIFEHHKAKLSQKNKQISFSRSYKHLIFSNLHKSNYI